MQKIFNRYINHLQAERNASAYTVRNYKTDLLDFFRFLLDLSLQSLPLPVKLVQADRYSFGRIGICCEQQIQGFSSRVQSPRSIQARSKPVTNITGVIPDLIRNPGW